MSDLITFSVEGTLPPKKDGASSMWRKRSCVRQLQAMREAAAAAMQGRPPFDEPVAVEIELVHDAGGPDLHARRRYGDLDNFVTGVCDGLQCAHPSAFDESDWAGLDDAVHPTRAIVFTDDSWVRRIVAEHVAGETLGFRVTVAPIRPE